MTMQVKKIRSKNGTAAAAGKRTPAKDLARRELKQAEKAWFHMPEIGSQVEFFVTVGERFDPTDCYQGRVVDRFECCDEMGHSYGVVLVRHTDTGELVPLLVGVNVKVLTAATPCREGLGNPVQSFTAEVDADGYHVPKPGSRVSFTLPGKCDILSGIVVDMCGFAALVQEDETGVRFVVQPGRDLSLATRPVGE